MGVSASVNLTINFPTHAELDRRIMDGENAAAERLLALSAERAPLDIGTLIGSGTVEAATTPEDGAAVVYDTPYAARLHEHPEYTFQGGREGKYVENPAMERKDELGAIVAKKVADG
ncbi:hypothetical protein [Streptomyces sp. AC495_CC817]|uniref:hypothetical protein n=1 Tax=Streptomyces sp. AC495_CC817 TaxID=2823900 RepID=UPI0020B7FE05|nr:hypothetical protein [Streptomyces sp. AC495_CC817]